MANDGSVPTSPVLAPMISAVPLVCSIALVTASSSKLRIPGAGVGQRAGKLWSCAEGAAGWATLEAEARGASSRSAVTRAADGPAVSRRVKTALKAASTRT